jgi:hypothetical protein
MSAEVWLENASRYFPPGLRSAVLGGAVRGPRLWVKLGLRTGKTGEAQEQSPVGRVIVAVLCSLAGNSQGVQHVEQDDDGCIITAAIPSDRRTFGGVLRVGIAGSATNTTINAEAEIPGQIYDWGTSKKALSTLFSDVHLTLSSDD